MKDLVSRHWFAFVSAIIVGVFAVLAEYQESHAFIFCIIYMTVIWSVHSIWVDNWKRSVITEAQMLAWFRRIRHKGVNNVVSNNRIAEIYRLSNELESKTYVLSPREMEELTSKAIRDLCENRQHQLIYYAIHGVNSDKTLHTWDSESPEENQRDEFVRSQRQLLDAGGHLTRIFIFSRAYFVENAEKCIRMLKKHNEYYKGTASQVRTMVYLSNPQRDTSLTQDFAIVGNNMVFEWYRSLSSDNDYGNGKCFTDEETVTFYLAKFKDLELHSKDLSQLI